MDFQKHWIGPSLCPPTQLLHPLLLAFSSVGLFDWGEVCHGLIIRGGSSVAFASCLPLIRGPANSCSVLVKKPPASLGQTQEMMGAVISLASAGPVP